MSNMWNRIPVKLRAAAAVVAATASLMVAWTELGFPRVVFSTELRPVVQRVESLEQFNRDTRLMVLDQAWWRIKFQLEELEERLESEEAGHEAHQLHNSLRRQLRDLERQMENLRT